MSDLWREDPNSDSHNYVAQSNIGGWSRISSHPVVPVEPETTVTTDGTAPVFVGLEAGKYLIVRLEADDDA